MQNNRFVVLMGHLNEYPLSDLIGILAHQRKTGRLLIEYPGTPASFYFEDGEIVDVQLATLSGLQAICVAMAQPASPFNFNPLIRASQRSIDDSMQRVVSELFGCWDESPLQVDVVTTPPALPTVDIDDTPALPADKPVLNEAKVLALPAFVPPTRQNRTNRTMAAAGLMMLGISVIAVSAGFQLKETPVGLSSATTDNRTQPALATSNGAHSSSEGGKARNSQRWKERDRRRDGKAASDNPANAGTSSELTEPAEAVGAENKNAPRDNAANTQWVDVVMKVENGRVLQAAVANHKSGVDGYEALALRIARQRRYPTNATGQETVRIRVARPE